MRDSTPNTRTVRDARADFYRASGFAPDGGYSEPWAEAGFGPLRYRVPNGPLRSAALRLHDLHHVATGYAADWRGEAEISAWELASGVGRVPYAWLIAIWGLFTGLVLAPGATYEAFLRGRGSRNLYSEPFDEGLLQLTVAELREALAVAPAGRPPESRMADSAAFAGWSLAAVALGAVSLVPALGLVALAAARGAAAEGRSLFTCPLTA